MLRRPQGAYKENIQREKSKKRKNTTLAHKHKTNIIYIMQHA